jgi:hypothetical protein
VDRLEQLSLSRSSRCSLLVGVAGPRAAQHRGLIFDESAIAMTVEINLRRSRGWPGTSPT